MAWHSDMRSDNDTDSFDSDTLPGLDPRQIEDFVDQLEQMPSRLENLGDAFGLGGRRRRGG
jgi:hypothetical protein